MFDCYSPQPEALPPNRTTTFSWFKSSSLGVFVGLCSSALTLPAKSSTFVLTASTDSLVARLSNKSVICCNCSLVT